MSLLADSELRSAMSAGEITIDPLAETNIQPASYDLRLGERAIISRSADLDRIQERLRDDDEVPEVDVSHTGSISVPAGGFALVVTRERVRLSQEFAGHIGLRSYFARKGVLLLAGLQIDPGFDGHLVLGLANVSPRSVYVAFEESIATLEIHRLGHAASEAYSGVYAGQQTTPTIPRADADYLRTIEAMSVSDLTNALLRLSDNVSTLTRDVRIFFIPTALAILVVLIAAALARLF